MPPMANSLCIIMGVLRHSASHIKWHCRYSQEPLKIGTVVYNILNVKKHLMDVIQEIQD